MSLLQRYRDWQNERRIKALSDACRLAMLLGDKASARELWSEMVVALHARSPQQIARMERRMGMA